MEVRINKFTFILSKTNFFTISKCYFYGCFQRYFEYVFNFFDRYEKKQKKKREKKINGFDLYECVKKTAKVNYF